MMGMDEDPYQVCEDWGWWGMTGVPCWDPTSFGVGIQSIQSWVQFYFSLDRFHHSCFFLVDIYIYMGNGKVNYNDLTVLPHWKSWLVRGIIPK